MIVTNAQGANITKLTTAMASAQKVACTRDIASLIRSLRSDGADSVANLQLLWIALSGCRANEAQYAKHCEINLDDMTWTIPANRRKVAQDLVIPITESMAKLLLVAAKNQPALAKGTQDYVFVTKTGAPLATMSIERAARHAGTSLIAIRHAFADWAKLGGKFPSELIEVQLGYDPSGVEAAYSRASYLPTRRHVMEAWAAYVMGDANV
jgi:integrase